MRGHVRDKWGIQVRTAVSHAAIATILVRWWWPAEVLLKHWWWQGNACEDCCIHYWCDGCAIMQETKEMSFRMLAQQPQPGTSNKYNAHK